MALLKIQLSKAFPSARLRFALNQELARALIGLA